MNLLTIGDFYRQRYGKGVEVLTSLAITYRNDAGAPASADLTTAAQTRPPSGVRWTAPRVEAATRVIAAEVLASALTIVAPFGEALDVDGHQLCVQLEKA